VPEQPLISLIVPTRGRPAAARRLLDSLAATAAEPDRLEAVLYVDRDDAPSRAIDHPGLRVVRRIGRRATMGRMTAACLAATAGQYCMLLNDDVVCRTDGWDARLVEAFERFADGVALVWCNDLFRGRRIPNFPALSRTACRVMGGLCPAAYRRDYIDTHLLDVFCKLKALGHDRLAYLPDVVIEHLHHQAGKAAPDATSVKARQAADELTFIAWEARRAVIAARLARHIEGRPLPKAAPRATGSKTPCAEDLAGDELPALRPRATGSKNPCAEDLAGNELPALRPRATGSKNPCAEDLADEELPALPHRTDQPELSIVLADWSCRHSAHVLDYLADQTLPRDRYEIIWVEFHDRLSPAVAERIDAAPPDAPPPVDVCRTLGVPREVCHHKHLMYNAGLLLARAPVVCFMDSDAMVRPTFAAAVLHAFRRDGDIVLHLDEVRNTWAAFYPFAYPPVADVGGFGCINWVNGATTGLQDRRDPLHSRNYGACMAAKREDLLAIGGADLHGDYLGHVCGPYEMTFRLAAAGRREVWHGSEWLYHVWHPGQAGERNYAGPHDGLQMSSRALAARAAGRVLPYVESPAVRRRRTGELPARGGELPDDLIEPGWAAAWRYDRLGGARRTRRLGTGRIWVREAGPAARRRMPPVLGYRLGAAARVGLGPLVARLVWRQLGTKRRAAGWSGPHPPASRLGRWRRKLRALAGFLARSLAFDRYRLRQCWLALSLAAQRGDREVVLYGDGEAAAMLCALARHLPVRVAGVCPEAPTARRRLFGRPVVAPEALAAAAAVVVADFVAVPNHLARLAELGVPRGRTITLT
jgi:hypothetical protein